MKTAKFLILGLIGTILFHPPCHAAETNAPATPPSKPAELREFAFPGGNVHSFVDLIDKTFALNFREIATIPNYMDGVRVPKMRIQVRDDSSTVLHLYNSISTDMDGRLGKWVIKALTTGLPNAIVLVGKDPADGSKGENQYVVRAFAYPGLNNDKLEVLRLTISDQEDQLIRFNRQSGTEILVQGNLQHHEKAGILVVTGSHAYVELAETIIDAFRQANPPKLPPSETK